MQLHYIYVLHAITFLLRQLIMQMLNVETFVETDYYIIDCVFLLIIQSTKAGRNSSSISG